MCCGRDVTHYEVKFLSHGHADTVAVKILGMFAQVERERRERRVAKFRDHEYIGGGGLVQIPVGS